MPADYQSGHARAPSRPSRERSACHGSRGSHVVRKTREPQSPIVVATLLVASLASCAPARRPESVTIVGVDYAFLPLPHVLPAGPTEFSFENRGTVEHMVLIAPLRDGVTVDSVLDASGPARDALIEEGDGALEAAPGERAPGRLLLDLRPGRSYLLVCILRDAPGKPRHAALGMFASFVGE